MAHIEDATFLVGVSPAGSAQAIADDIADVAAIAGVSQSGPRRISNIVASATTAKVRTIFERGRTRHVISALYSRRRRHSTFSRTAG
jgi:hypothetical protein